MAKKQGMINVRGSVGDITYRQTKNGFRVGLKSNLTADSIKKCGTFSCPLYKITGNFSFVSRLCNFFSIKPLIARFARVELS